MKKTIVICGDSYGYGIGCVDLETSPYGVLLSNMLDCNLIRLARGSASNFSIALQAEYAVEKINPKPDLVVIGMTSFDRLEWQVENSSRHRFEKLGLENLNYHLYPPHHMPASPLEKIHDFYLQDDGNYDPILLTEHVPGLADYIDHVRKGHKVATGFFKRLNSEPIPKLELIMNYYFDVFQGNIKVRYDAAMIFQAYMKCINSGTNCIIMAAQPELFSGLVPGEHLCEVDWWKLSVEHPDTIGSLHTSETGHQIVAEKVAACIERLGILK